MEINKEVAGKWYYCEQCSHVVAMGWGKKENCPYCGYELKVTEEIHSLQEEPVFQEKLRKGPNFSETAFIEREKKMDESIAASLAQTRAQRELEPHCPACGCTDIQVVRKNWSPGSGIFTNQVERVCARCLFRF